MPPLETTSNTTSSKLSGRDKIFGAGISLFVVLISLIAGEFALRQWWPLGGVVLERDARYLFRYIPDSRKIKFPFPGSGAQQVLLVINRQGRRGDLLVPDHGPRIMVYGDSFIASEGTPVRDTFVAQLRDMLAARMSRRPQAINAGVPGYGPDQESLVMEDEIDSIRPDLMIVALYSGNDFGDLVRNKLFTLDERQQLVAGHPRLDASLNRYFKEAGNQPRLQLQRRFIALIDRAKHSRLARMIGGQTVRKAGSLAPSIGSNLPVSQGDSIDNWLVDRRKEYKSAAIDRDDLVDNLFGDTYDADLSLEPDSDSARYKKLLMERVMERIQALASSRRVPLVFLFIPDPIDVVDRWSLAVNSQAYPLYRRSGLTDTLETIARAHGMNYVNLYEPFREHPAKPLYFRVPEDDHWNAEGQRVAAALMTRFIMEKRLLAAADTGR